MKSNQERSNECLPPKKREILALEEKTVVVASPSENQRGENLAWLASVASAQNPEGQHDGLLRKPLASATNDSSSSCSSSSSASLSRVAVAGKALTTLPAVYSSPLSQPAGAIQYAQLPPNVQFISSSYGGAYTGYIASQLISSTATSAPALVQRPEMEVNSSTVVSQTSKADQHNLLGTALPPQSTHPAGQYVQIAGSPLSMTAGTLASPAGQLHSTVLPHTLTLTPSQVVVQYTDSPVAKKDEGQRELLNGELEKGRRYGLLLEASLIKQSGVPKTVDSQPQQHFEAQHLVIPADYTQEISGLQTSLMLRPNNQGNSTDAEQDCHPEKPPFSVAHGEKVGVGLSKPISSKTSFSFPSSTSSEKLKTHITSLTPHTVIQTAPSAAEEISMGVSTSTLYHASQPPIIGYIASSGQQQQAVSYNATLPQHLIIPSGQSLLVPISSSGGGEQEPSHTVVTTPQQISVSASQSYEATSIPKSELVGFQEQQPIGAYAATAPATSLVQAQVHLPVPATPTPLLPPYFMKGSIIQLADGELKRVEDLRTEDFIHSAEMSGELKLNSSTVERIDGSATPNSAIIQFSVGEHRVQVCVEVLVEYPFFVFGQGWSSCCPDRTTQLFELACAKLSVGDVCISLTLKNLKNGSLRKTQSQAADLPLKPTKTESQRRDRVGNCRERENGLGQWAEGIEGKVGNTVSENGELKFGEKNLTPQARQSDSVDTDRPSARKRRWSAPEGRQVEKSSEGPTPPLPKTTFIPQEVKISIEGRSSIGK